MSQLLPTGLVAIVLLSGGVGFAQAPQPGPATQKENLVVTPIAKLNLGRADFGLKEAAKTLPVGQWRIVTPRPKQVTPFSLESPLTVTPADPLTVTSGEPVDCKMVKSHRTDLLPAIMVITPPPGVKHHIKAITVPPCPVR